MRALFVTLDGGGNLRPALGIAQEIVRRGGSVRFLGNEVQRAAIEAAGLPFEPFRHGPDYDASQPRSTLSAIRDLTALFASRGIGRDALALLRSEPVDAVLVDCLLWGAALEIADADVPVVSLVHSQWEYFRKNARGPIGKIARLRGANAVRAESAAALTLVTTRSDIETDPSAPEAAGARHVGFVWQGTPIQAEPDRARPRVLVSFSTTSFPGQQEALQSAVDALADAPVDLVVTTGAVSASALRVPVGVRVEQRIDHRELLPTTALVVGHGGHATTARALAHGIPLLVLPMHPLLDQPAIGRAVERLGVGRSMSKKSSAVAIRAAVMDLLADGAMRARARKIGAEIRAQDGAVVAADLLESVLVPHAL